MKTKLIAALTMAVLAAPAAAQCHVFADTTFNNNDWDVTMYLLIHNGGTGSASQQTSGGNPGDYRMVTHVVNAAAPGQQSVMYEFHRRIGFTYDPQTEGAIHSIDFTVDTAMVGGDAVGSTSGFGFRQNGTVYRAVPGLVVGTTPIWTGHAQTGLTVASFSDEVGFTTPDFSASGGLIELGYATSNATSIGGGSYTTVIGWDNWNVTIHRAGTQTPRFGVPPNAGVLSPDTIGPRIGTNWSPTVSGIPSTVDVVFLSIPPGINVPIAFGTLLCSLPAATPLLVHFPAGTPIPVPLPNNCNLVGFAACAQGAGITFSPLTIQLTNALDIVIGS